MNKQLFSVATLCFGFGLWAQESRTYTESFKVGDQSVLSITTSHADIEFDTWNKNEVSIVATVTLEDATKEEAEKYFENPAIKIMGNSSQIEITSRPRHPRRLRNGVSRFHDIEFETEPLFEFLEIPDLPEIAVMPDMPPLPPMPPIKVEKFDYEAFKKDGDEYLEKWTERFQEGFDEEYEQKMEEWGKKMEKRTKAWEERNAGRMERLGDKMEKRNTLMEARRKALRERRNEQREIYQQRREELVERRSDLMAKRAERTVELMERRRNFRNPNRKRPNVFYFNSNGNDKHFKVKKTIKIKMPKSVKLKMNVRHGEVKLAANVRKIKASLRHASLLATSVDGVETEIEAAYSPMTIEQWKAGKLNTKFSDNVKLKTVHDLYLNGTSSNISIDRVVNAVHVVNDLGKIAIHQVSPGFKGVHVALTNGELAAVLPKTSCNVTISDILSEVTYPDSIKPKLTKTSNGYEIKGYVSSKKQDNPFFKVDASYSKVVLK